MYFYTVKIILNICAINKKIYGISAIINYFNLCAHYISWYDIDNSRSTGVYIIIRLITIHSINLAVFFIVIMYLFMKHIFSRPYQGTAIENDSFFIFVYILYRSF